MLPFLRYLLLAVLFAPLVFAAITAAVGRFGTPVARRTALWLAVVHLLLTGSLVMLAAPVLSERKGADRDSAADCFQPIAVPGDVGGDEFQSNETSWNLFTLSPSGLKDAPSSVQFYIGLDGLNIWLVLLSSLLSVIAVLVSWVSIRERAAGFYACLFVLQTAIIGAFVSFDVVLFYVFFELTLVPSFFLIGSWGVGSAKRDAARKFVLYTLFGGLLTLSGLIGIVLTNPTPLDPRASATPTKMTTPVWLPEPGRTEAIFPEPGPVTFSINRLMKNVALWSEVKQKRVENAAPAEREKALAEQQSHRSTQAILFFLLIAGFVVKVPLVPFHTWLPSAYAEAPTGVVMIFSALMAKLGTLGFLRIVIPLAPDASVTYGLQVLGFLGAVGIIYAAFCAYAQRDLKLIAAYSSVSHLGLLVLGMFALNKEGLTGAALHMVNHGLSAGAFFALIGFLHDRYRTTDTNSYSGLISRFPAYSFLMIVICLASVGLPGLNNFVSEMMLMAGLFTPWSTTMSGYGLAVAAAAGLFFSAWYTFTMVRKVFFGPLLLPPAPGDIEPLDLTRQEVVAFGIPVILCLGLGLFPQPVLDTMKADIAVIAQQTDRARVRIDKAVADQETPPPPVVKQLPAGPQPKGVQPKKQ